MVHRYHSELPFCHLAQSNNLIFVDNAELLAGTIVQHQECVIYFTPSIHIEKTSENYIITMSFRTVYGESQDNVVGEDFLPVELERMDKREYVLLFEHKLSKVTGIDYKLFVEIQYDTEDTLKFRYAENEEDLEEQEFYTLHRVAE